MVFEKECLLLHIIKVGAEIQPRQQTLTATELKDKNYPKTEKHFNDTESIKSKTNTDASYDL